MCTLTTNSSHYVLLIYSPAWPFFNILRLKNYWLFFLPLPIFYPFLFSAWPLILFEWNDSSIQLHPWQCLLQTLLPLIFFVTPTLHKLNNLLSLCLSLSIWIMLEKVALKEGWSHSKCIIINFIQFSNTACKLYHRPLAKLSSIYP